MPPVVPPPGTAYRTLIERALNHEITPTLGIVDLADGIMHNNSDAAFVTARIASFNNWAMGGANAQAELQLPRIKKKGGTYSGASTGTASQFGNIAAAMNRLGPTFLGDSFEILYRAMRVFLQRFEHYVAGVAAEQAFRDGWDAAKGYWNPWPAPPYPLSTPPPVDAARDTAASNYKDGFDIHRVPTILHSTY